jgi:hypothetical protein
MRIGLSENVVMLKMAKHLIDGEGFCSGSHEKLSRSYRYMLTIAFKEQQCQEHQKSPLASESHGIRKEEDVVVEQLAELADRKKMCYMGTLVLEGRAKSIVWIPEYRNYKSQRSKISNQRINNQQYRSLARKRATALENSKSRKQFLNSSRKHKRT